MSITKTRYSAASEAAVPDQDYQPTTMDILKLEISCVRGNRWMTSEEKQQKINQLRFDLAPNMSEIVFQGLLG